MAKRIKPATANALSKVSAGTLADLIGNSVTVKMDDGTTVIVPVDGAGNRIANMVVAASVRHILEKSIKTYREKDMLPTPKDLKDLAEAAKSLAQFSAEVYKAEEGAPIADKPKEVKEATPAADTDFDDIPVEEVQPK